MSQALGEPRLNRGSALLEVDGAGIVFEFQPARALPPASLVKVMTAHLVLKELRLTPAAPGPVFTIDEASAAGSRAMADEDQSCIVVEPGQRFTALDLLRGMLIASAGNFAELLALWRGGTLDAFVRRMNHEARGLGLEQTSYFDVSGFSDASTSTARDQVRLARAAMRNPDFAGVASETAYDAGPAGAFANTNTLLSTKGVAGIKTGFTEVSGANFLFAARLQPRDEACRVFGAVLGQEDRCASFALASRLLDLAV